MSNLQFDATLEFIENGLRVGENLTIKVREVQNSTNKTICEAKRSYFERLGDKLYDSQYGRKHFWTAFRRSTNKKKLTNIPPILENNTYVTNFQQEAKIFNDYFAEQCKIHANGSARAR